MVDHSTRTGNRCLPPLRRTRDNGAQTGHATQHSAHQKAHGGQRVTRPERLVLAYLAHVQRAGRSYHSAPTASSRSHACTRALRASGPGCEPPEQSRSGRRLASAPCSGFARRGAPGGGDVLQGRGRAKPRRARWLKDFAPATQGRPRCVSARSLAPLKSIDLPIRTTGHSPSFSRVACRADLHTRPPWPSSFVHGEPG
jgi:hypothetical protein